MYGGGGGTIVADEIDYLHRYGVARIFSPQDGQAMGLAAMVNTMIAECDRALPLPTAAEVEAALAGDHRALARVITALETGSLDRPGRTSSSPRPRPAIAPRVLGITGTGGSGKSSLTDELVRRFRIDQEDKLRVAVLAIDPTRRRGGGALLGDRIRMNAIDSDGAGAAGSGATAPADLAGTPLAGGRVYFRSFATRGSGSELPAGLDDAIAACRAAGFDLVIVETPGIGQGDAAVVPHVDFSLYVMTPEFGAASQLEKIDMLDFAGAVAINKFERRGGPDALRDVRRQLARTGDHPGVPLEELPVYGTVASRFNDDGVTALYQFLRDQLAGPRFEGRGLPLVAGQLPVVSGRTSTRGQAIVPPDRDRYLADIALTVRGYHRATDAEVAAARRRQQLRRRGQTAERRRPQRRCRRGRGPRRRGRPTRRAVPGQPPAARRPGRPGSPSTGTTGLTRLSLSGTPVPRVAVAPVRRRRRVAALAAQREPARANSPTPPACFPSSGRARTRPGCSRAKATPSGPTGASTCWPPTSPPPGCPPPSTR